MYKAAMESLEGNNLNPCKWSCFSWLHSKLWLKVWQDRIAPSASDLTLVRWVSTLFTLRCIILLILDHGIVKSKEVCRSNANVTLCVCVSQLVTRSMLIEIQQDLFILIFIFFFSLIVVRLNNLFKHSSFIYLESYLSWQTNQCKCNAVLPIQVIVGLERGSRFWQKTWRKNKEEHSEGNLLS